jgi:hypothetical protein
MIAFISSHAAVFVAVGLPIYNIVMSAMAQIFTKLGKAEPTVLQALGNVGLKLTQWLSANTPSPQAQVSQITPPKS